MGRLMDMRVRGLRRRIGDFELIADFTVQVGERAVLEGPSGSGKTSLLRLLSGLDPCDGGSLFLGDAEMTREAAHRRGMGVIFQDQALFGSMDVLDNASYGLRVRGVSRAEREAEALRWLDRVGLGSRARAPVDELSGGERQRVAWVRALVWKPRVLLLDEPFSALDRALRAELRAELVRLHALWPAPLILVTHDREDVRELATSRLEVDAASRVRRVRKVVDRDSQV